MRGLPFWCLGGASCSYLQSEGGGWSPPLCSRLASVPTRHSAHTHNRPETHEACGKGCQLVLKLVPVPILFQKLSFNWSLWGLLRGR